MNDFTLEELQCMLELVESIKIVNRIINDDELQEKLQSMVDNYCKHEPNGEDKIQSMIYNYCEHEKDGRIYNGVLGLSFKCLKCNRFIC